MEFNRNVLLPEDENSIFLDLGCGIKKVNNCVGIDKIETQCTDYVHDFEKMGIPFSSSIVDGIAMFDVIEHLHDWVFVMNEVYRVLKPGGTIEIHYPVGMSPGYRNHAMHVKPWWPDMFRIFDFNNPTSNPDFIHMQKSSGLKCDFLLEDNDVMGKEDEGVGIVLLKSRKAYPENFIPVLSSRNYAICSDRQEAVRVELGCGWTRRMKPHPFIGVDGYLYKDKETGEPIVDIVKDLERGVPFSDDSVDIVFASHFMEHVNDLIGVIEEVYRVLKPNGVLEMINPWWESVFAHANPDHKRLIHEGLWGYWDNQPTDMDKEAYGIRARFEQWQNKHRGDGLFTTLIAIKDKHA